MAGGPHGGLLHGVISWRDEDLERLRLVASAMAGRPVALEAAEEDAPGYTDGRVVYLPAAADRADVLAFLAVQGALLAAGSLEPALMGRMTGRASVARRYLAVEGWRALAEMADRLPAAADRRSRQPGRPPVVLAGANPWSSLSGGAPWPIRRRSSE